MEWFKALDTKPMYCNLSLMLNYMAFFVLYALSIWLTIFAEWKLVALLLVMFFIYGLWYGLLKLESSFVLIRTY